jgi:VWFA-related protein
MKASRAWGALSAALLAPGAGLAQAPAPSPPTLVFRSGVEAVYVDVFVTKSGQPVPGLVAADFELKDNRVAQRVELVSAETRPLLAVLVFDTSNSMEGDRLAALRAAGEAFLDGLRAADQASLLSFSEELRWLAPPTTDKASVRAALGQLRAEGATAAFDALYAGIVLSEGGLRPLIVEFTDGEDNLSWLGERQLRLLAERSNALVHVVGWQPPPPPPSAWRRSEVESPQVRALRQIAELTGGRLWLAASRERLREAFAAIADAMGQRYVLRYEPQGVRREGEHRIEVRLRGRKGDVHARRGYWVAP